MWEIPWDEPDERPLVKELFANLQRELGSLENLLKECNGEWTYEDGVYRFYHQSFKVFSLQSSTLKVVEVGDTALAVFCRP